MGPGGPAAAAELDSGAVAPIPWAEVRSVCTQPFGMTISKITFHPEAAAEVESGFHLVSGAERPVAAGSFLKALEEALEAIAASPERWPLFAEVE